MNKPKRVVVMKNIVLLFLFLVPVFLFAQYPTGTNKSRLGYQTTGDGLIWRGIAADTAIKPRTTANAYFQLDTVNGILRRYIATRGSWQTVSGGGGGSLTMPFDSITFNPTTVDPDTAELKYNADLETFVFGADGTIIEIGQKTAWYVKNQTGSTINKGTVVRASGTLGSSGRILISPMVIDGTVPSKYLLGITASNIANGSDGYVIHFGKLRKFNTSAWADGAVLYAGTGGTLTATEPSPPNLRLPIAFVVHSHATNGILAIRIQTGNELHELHDVDTTGIQNNGLLTWNSSSQKWQAAAPDNDKSSTNEIQTLSFASPLLAISSGNNVDLSPILTGYVTGSGTTNYIPKWSALTNLTTSNIFDNNTYAGVISRPWKFGEYTTAGLPTGVAGYHVYNTTIGGTGWYDGTRWNYIPKAVKSAFTSTYVPFANSSGQFDEDSNFFFTSSGVKKLTVPAGSSASNSNGLEFFGSNLGAGGAGFYFTGGTVSLRSDNNTRLSVGNAIADFVAPNAIFRLNSATIFNTPVSTALQVGSGYRDIYLDPTTGTTPTRVFMFGTANGNNIKFQMLSTTGFLGLNMGTTAPRYQLDVTSTDAFAFPRGTVAQRPTIVSNTTPMRFNTDSTALEYGESVGTWRLLATRAYARSLVSGLVSTNIYNSNGTLTGNRTITSGNYDVLWDNVTGFTLQSGSITPGTTVLSDVYTSRKQFYNLGKTSHFQVYNSTDTRSFITSRPNFVDIYEFKFGGTTKYEWGTWVEIDTTNSVFFYKEGGQDYPGFFQSRLDRPGTAGLYLNIPKWQFVGRASVGNQNANSYHTLWSSTRDFTGMIMGIKDEGKFLLAPDSTMIFDPLIDVPQFNKMGVGNKEAADLSKTESVYSAWIATDGTIIEKRANTEQYNTITSTSSPQTLSNTISDNLINQGGTQATFTLTFPASPVDGQVLKITYNNAITTLTLDGNGNTIVGSAVTTGVAGSQRAFKFYTGIGWIKLY